MLEKVTIKNIFLIDGVGAFMSALALGLFLPRLYSLVGLPVVVFYILALWAFTYSISCYLLISFNKRKYLSILIFLNSLYLFVTLTCMIYYYDKVSVLEFVYFIVEMVIITKLIFIEKRILKEL